MITLGRQKRSRLLATVAAKQFTVRVTRIPALLFGGILVTLVVIIAVIGPSIAPYDPLEHDYSAILQVPGRGHWLGTDNFGRDILSRILCGTRIDLQIGIICVVLPFIIGVTIGCVSGYYGGVADVLLMRLVDMTVAFPFYVLIIAILAILGPGVVNMYIAITLVGWIAYAKMIRGELLIARNLEYALAARALGFSQLRILFRHLLPNVITPCIVFAMTDVVLCIGFASSLSFLGLGVQPPHPEWGVMIADGREFIVSAWWMATCPGLAIAIVGIGFSLFGDGLAELLRPEGR
jgi:peptide/nickel transport system permease protein